MVIIVLRRLRIRGVGVVGKAIGGKRSDGYLVGAVENVGARQVVVGSGKFRWVRKNIGGPPAERDGLSIGQGVKVVGGVSAGDFIQEIGLGIWRNRVSFFRSV